MVSIVLVDPFIHNALLMQLLRYLAKLESTKLILWCYFAWYLAIVIRYFEASWNLWLSTLGISLVIGFALNLAAKQKGGGSDRWVVFRLYLFPFCVSSYSSLIKDRGFFLLFPTDPWSVFAALAACAAVIISAMAAKFFCKAPPL